jgi:PPOX class probable F420-dependent enzyme
VITVPEGFEDLLVRPLIGDLATIRPDGDPSITPMWYVWDGDLLRFTHTNKRRKFRNIAHNPHVAFSVFDPADPYRYLQLRGNVESIEPDPTGAFFVELGKRYKRKNLNPPADAADRVILVVRPFVYSAMHRREAS